MARKTKKNAPATAEQSAPVATAEAAPKKAARIATPQRTDRDEQGRLRKGPDPVALKEGRINPAREGKVFDAIRSGTGASVSDLVTATGLREPTVRYFGISAAEAGLIDSVRIGRQYYFIVTAKDKLATATALKLRESVLAMVKSSTEAKAEAK